MARMENNDTKKVVNIILIDKQQAVIGDSRALRLSAVVLAIFLLLDSFLSIILGKRYILWGLEYAPSRHKHYIERILSLSTMTLFKIRLTEMMIGTTLLWMGIFL